MDSCHPFRSQAARERYLVNYDARAKRWPIASEEHLVRTSQGETFVRIGGPPNGKPIVLLPGLGATSLMWIPTIPVLARQYRTFAVDTLGDSGRSVAATPMSRVEDYLQWLDELLNGLRLNQKVRMVGMSYGGWLAGEYAVHAPNRIGKLVLLAPGATVLPVRLAFMARIALNLTGRRRALSSFFYWLFADFARINAAAIEEFIDAKVLERACLKPVPPLKPRRLTDSEFQGLTMPVLFVVGENEKIYSPQKAVRRLKRVAPQIESVIIPGAGHDLVAAQPDKVSATILEFLRDPSAPLSAGPVPR
jgi:pimeloyl-ACP methyl ester carboxylesterase